MRVRKTQFDKISKKNTFFIILFAITIVIFFGTIVYGLTTSWNNFYTYLIIYSKQGGHINWLVFDDKWQDFLIVGESGNDKAIAFQQAVKALFPNGVNLVNYNKVISDLSNPDTLMKYNNVINTYEALSKVDFSQKAYLISYVTRSFMSNLKNKSYCLLDGTVVCSIDIIGLLWVIFKLLPLRASSTCQLSLSISYKGTIRNKTRDSWFTRSYEKSNWIISSIVWLTLAIGNAVLVTLVAKPDYFYGIYTWIQLPSIIYITLMLLVIVIEIILASIYSYKSNYFYNLSTYPVQAMLTTIYRTTNTANAKWALNKVFKLNIDEDMDDSYNVEVLTKICESISETKAYDSNYADKVYKEKMNKFTHDSKQLHESIKGSKSKSKKPNKKDKEW